MSERAAWNEEIAGFPNHMLKEIYDQPEAIEATIARHLHASGRIVLEREPLSAERLRSLRRLRIIASGASRHAGIAARIMIEELAGLPVTIEHASEYCYRKPVREDHELAVVITQSGETADTIAAQRVAREAGVPTVAVSNFADSTIVRESDGALLTYAGKEIAIPATKSFTTQLSVLYLFALYLAEARGSLTREALAEHLRQLREIPAVLATSLDGFDKDAARVARSYYRDQSFYVIGRGIHHPMALEGALKLKEVCYIHAEGYPAGELRHGPTALVGETTPVLAIVTRDQGDPASMLRYEKTVALVEELRKKSDRLIVLACEDDSWAREFGAANLLTVPPAPELLLPLLEAVPLQLFSYHVAMLNGLDVDRPRNLVKSVQQD